MECPAGSPSSHAPFWPQFVPPRGPIYGHGLKSHLILLGVAVSMLDAAYDWADGIPPTQALMCESRSRYVSESYAKHV